jgi:hypothetical protein
MEISAFETSGEDLFREIEFVNEEEIIEGI